MIDMEEFEVKDVEDMEQDEREDMDIDMVEVMRPQQVCIFYIIHII